MPFSKQSIATEQHMPSHVSGVKGKAKAKLVAQLSPRCATCVKACAEQLALALLRQCVSSPAHSSVCDRDPGRLVQLCSCS
jgi:hypothetical protein